MIDRIRIQNFKSLGDVTVDLRPATILIGRSGTGKTNFVQAVRFLRDVLYFGLSQTLQANGGAERVFSVLGEEDRELQIDVQFRVAGMDEPFDYGFGVGRQANSPMVRLTREHLRFGQKCLFEKQMEKSPRGDQCQWTTPPPLVSVPLPVEITLGQLPAIPESVVAHTALTSGIGCHHFGWNVLTLPEPRELPQPNRPLPLPGLADDASNHLSIFRQIATDLENLQAKKTITADMACLNKSISAVELDSTQNPTKLLIAHTYGDQRIALDLTQESDGFRRFLAHVLALFQRPAKQTLLFEEPENGIYPAALSLLAEEFRDAHEAGFGQVIVTTHNPGLVDRFQAEDIRVVELDGWQTRIGPLAEEQKEAVEQRLLDPGELLTVDEARAVASPREQAGP